MTSLQNKTLLVTGGAGAIGSNLVRHLLTLNPAKVIVLDNLSSGYPWLLPRDPRLLFVQGDITVEQDLIRVFHERPAFVFHLAAFFANQRSVDYPLRDAEVNVQGTLRLLEFSVLAGCVERFVYTNSEGGVYGAENALPYREGDSSMKLGSPYYITKHAGEMYCHYYAARYGLPVSIPRMFNSFGPGEVPGQYRNVIPNFIWWALRGNPLPLTGSSENARDFVYVGDAVKAIALAATTEAARGEAFNIATGNPIRIHELAALIQELTGSTAGFVHFPARKWDQKPCITGSAEKAAEILGWKPETSLMEGLRHTLDWFRQHMGQIEAAADFPPGMSAAIEGFQAR